MTVLEIPCGFHIVFRNILAKFIAEMVVPQEIKYHIFVSWSTTPQIASCSSDHSNLVIKFIKILVHGFTKTEKGFKILAEYCQEVQLS
jgi:hypothetical protein